MLPPPKNAAEVLARYRYVSKGHDDGAACDPFFGHEYCIGWAANLLGRLSRPDHDINDRISIAKALAPEVFALADQLIWEEPSGEEAVAGLAPKCRLCGQQNARKEHGNDCPGNNLWDQLDRGQGGGYVREMR